MLLPRNTATCHSQQPCLLLSVHIGTHSCRQVQLVCVPPGHHSCFFSATSCSVPSPHSGIWRPPAARSHFHDSCCNIPTVRCNVSTAPNRASPSPSVHHLSHARWLPQPVIPHCTRPVPIAELRCPAAGPLGVPFTTCHGAYLSPAPRGQPARGGGAGGADAALLP